MSSIYEKYGLKQVINTSGRMTILGVSTPREDVIDAVDYGLNHYFEIRIWSTRPAPTSPICSTWRTR